MQRIDKEVVVAAPLPMVWDAWTTTEGLRSFFAPAVKMRLELNGPFEVLFDLDQPVGLQGSEGCRVLSYVPMELLSFDWNAPPELPAARAGPKSFVVVRLARVDERHTRVLLTHLGWEQVVDRDAVYAYFQRAWAAVLCWLERRFEAGSIDWTSGPPPRPAKTYDVA